MKSVYFVHRDNGSEERQSDGVEFAIIPQMGDNKIYFYCSEYAQFWESIEDVGNPGLVKNFPKIRRIRPATLTEICEAGLIGHVDTVKEMDGTQYRYIHLS